MRKMATIRVIESIAPIKGADAIECAKVDGWRVVVKKGEFAVGSRVVFAEIDSWIPTEIAPFLSKGKEPREFQGIKGERLRTVKLRGQLSQGLILPLCALTALSADGDDVSELLNIQKWEAQNAPGEAGVPRGNFPSQIPKTDQERVQNIGDDIEAFRKAGTVFEVTEKLEGSSMTCYLIDGVFGVCSRNIDLKEDGAGHFWATARANDIEAKMRAIAGHLELTDFALQGELIGPGVQGNIYNLSKHEYRVFDIYDIIDGEYIQPLSRELILRAVGVDSVPVLSTGAVIVSDVDGLLATANGKSVLAPNRLREGLVYKEIGGGATFKVISDEYLLKE